MNCRSCHLGPLISILSLGDMPLANRLLKSPQLSEPEPKALLEIMLCSHCSLVQLKELVSPATLFSDYLYYSSNSEAMITSVAELSKKIIPTLPANGRIIEIGSNDGYLLQHYLNHSFDILGIEPAQNIADYANTRGINTHCDYFSLALAQKFVSENKQADIIHANNVMAHIPDINDFAQGIKCLLAAKGRAVIEVPYLLNLINQCQFDTIYHEHVFYFSLSALMMLFNRHQLTLFDVEEIPLHGGSLRIWVAHEGLVQPTEKLLAMKNQEDQLNIFSIDYYKKFSTQISDLKKSLWQQLTHLKQQNKKIAAYGASAKGAILLNYFNLSEDMIDFVVDRSPFKQGYFMPGKHLEIQPVEFLIENNIDYTLLLSWNFSEEILQQQQQYRNQGGKFIIPIPSLEIV